MVCSGTVFWGGEETPEKTDKGCINRLVREAGRVTAGDLVGVDSIYRCLLSTKLDSLWNNSNHPLHDYLKRCLITRSGTQTANIWYSKPSSRVLHSPSSVASQ